MTGEGWKRRHGPGLRVRQGQRRDRPPRRAAPRCSPGRRSRRRRDCTRSCACALTARRGRFSPTFPARSGRVAVRVPGVMYTWRLAGATRTRTRLRRSAPHSRPRRNGARRERGWWRTPATAPTRLAAHRLTTLVRGAFLRRRGRFGVPGSAAGHECARNRFARRRSGGLMACSATRSPSAAAAAPPAIRRRREEVRHGRSVASPRRRRRQPAAASSAARALVAASPRDGVLRRGGRSERIGSARR